jgi:hypothetical protein
MIINDYYSVELENEVKAMMNYWEAIHGLCGLMCNPITRDDK